MRILLSTILLVLAILVSFATMIYGWGIPPENWLIIIIGSVAILFLNALGFALNSN